MKIVEKWRQRGDNVLLFYRHRFLLLPTSEVLFGTYRDDPVQVSDKVLLAAFDVTPNLKSADETLVKRFLEKAWRDQVWFANQLSVEWAHGIAQSTKGRLTVTGILQAYQ